MTLAARDARLVRAFASAVIGRFDVLRAEAQAFGPPDRDWRENIKKLLHFGFWFIASDFQLAFHERFCFALRLCLHENLNLRGSERKRTIQ